jgi:2-octaprenylphenol hydroxylase
VQEITHDIVIVGAGMVGSLFACALRESGFRLALIDTQPPRKPDTGGAFEPRVSALTRASERMLENVGALQKLESTRLCRFTDMDVWEADGTGHVHFRARDLGEEHLGILLENRLLQWALTETAVSNPQLEFICPDSLKTIERLPDCWQVSLASGRVLRTQLVVGADGAMSQVRQQAGLPLRELDYDQKAIVTTVRSSEPHQFTAWQRFLPTGPLAFLPLLTQDGDAHSCSIVWTLDTPAAEKILALDDVGFCAELGRAFEHRLGSIIDADARFAFPLRARHAEDYAREGLALIGDAAHTIHPLAGQGVNLGLLDAAVLAEEILRAQQRGLPVSEYSTLRRYSRRRRGHNALLMHTMTGFQKLFGADDLGLRLLRNTGMRIFDRLGPVKNQVMREAMGLSGELPGLAR